MHMSFDRSIRSEAFRVSARDEAARLWKDYGVDLVWADDDAAPGLCLDAVVERDRRAIDVSGPPTVLGRTRLVNGILQVPIRISFDAVDAVLDAAHVKPVMHDQAMALALGRVLAHEVGHVLLGAPSYHDPDGLMRASFQSNDLKGFDDRPFRLSDSSIARLHRRLASLDTRPSGCSATGT
jgi:hypothetical protein